MIEKSPVPNLTIKFFYCNLSEQAVVRLYEALQHNRTLIGFACSYNPCQYSNEKLRTDFYDKMKGYIIKSKAPLQFWNEKPISPEILKLKSSNEEGYCDEDLLQFQIDELQKKLVRQLEARENKLRELKKEEIQLTEHLSTFVFRTQAKIEEQTIVERKKIELTKALDEISSTYNKMESELNKVRELHFGILKELETINSERENTERRLQQNQEEVKKIEGLIQKYSTTTPEKRVRFTTSSSSEVKYEPDICSNCLERKVQQKSPCGHGFCQVCFDQLAEQKLTCSFCKS